MTKRRITLPWAEALGIARTANIERFKHFNDVIPLAFSIEFTRLPAGFERKEAASADSHRTNTVCIRPTRLEIGVVSPPKRNIVVGRDSQVKDQNSKGLLQGIVALMLVLYAAPAAAYIDPGTGSALFYVITGIVMSLYFAMRSLYYRVIEQVFRIRRQDQKCGIAVHCEDPRYETTFLPILRALSARGMEATLFTMYPRDHSYEPLPEGISHYAIPPGVIGYSVLNHLEAAVLVTTTPQLDVMTFRRSPRVRHYAMVQHALGESRFVRPYAYDYFDSVLCCGPILKQNIRRMEAIRGGSAKNLLETGVPYYDKMLEAANHTSLPSGNPVVLVAPSWGPLSMFTSLGTGFVAAIARHYRVIVRPHPQMRISQPDLYAEVIALPNVEIDTTSTPASSLSRAHVLLSDISGIAHECAFVFQRPVLVIDQQQRTGGLEGELLGGDSELKERCKAFIVPIPPSEIGNIVAHLERTLSQHAVSQIEQTREELVYCFGHAAETAAEQIGQIYLRCQASALSRTTGESMQ